MNAISQGTLPTWPQSIASSEDIATRRLMSVCKSCWKENPLHRPSMETLQDDLQNPSSDLDKSQAGSVYDSDSVQEGSSTTAVTIDSVKRKRVRTLRMDMHRVSSYIGGIMRLRSAQ